MRFTVMILSVLFGLAAVYGGEKKETLAQAPVAPIVPKIKVSPVYIGLGALIAGVSRECACADAQRLKDLTYGGVARAGWDLNRFFGVEARYVKSSLEKNFSTVEHYGVFLKPQYYMGKRANVFALIGYGKTTVEGCNLSGDLEKEGVSFGVGFEYDLSLESPEGEYLRDFDGKGEQEKGWSLWVDWQRLLDNEGIFGVNTNVFSIGVVYDF